MNRIMIITAAAAGTLATGAMGSLAYAHERGETRNDEAAVLYNSVEDDAGGYDFRRADCEWHGGSLWDRRSEWRRDLCDHESQKRQMPESADRLAERQGRKDHQADHEHEWEDRGEGGDGD